MNDGLVCSAGMDKMVRVWNIKTGANIKSFAGHNDSVFTLLGLADGRLVSGSADNTLRVWNLTTSHCDLIIQGHTDSVQYSLLLWDGVHNYNCIASCKTITLYLDLICISMYRPSVPLHGTRLFEYSIRILGLQ